MFASASDGFAFGQQPFIDRAREPQTDSNQYWFLLLIWIASFFARELLCVCFCVFASLCVCCSESDQLEDTPLSAFPINHIRLSVFGVLLFLVICLTGLFSPPLGHIFPASSRLTNGLCGNYPKFYFWAFVQTLRWPWLASSCLCRKVTDSVMSKYRVSWVEWQICFLETSILNCPDSDSFSQR